MTYRDRYDEPAMLQKYNKLKMIIWICEKSPAQRACRDLTVHSLYWWCLTSCSIQYIFSWEVSSLGSEVPKMYWRVSCFAGKCIYIHITLLVCKPHADTHIIIIRNGAICPRTLRHVVSGGSNDHTADVQISSKPLYLLSHHHTGGSESHHAEAFSNFSLLLLEYEIDKETPRCKRSQWREGNSLFSPPLRAWPKCILCL